MANVKIKGIILKLTNFQDYDRYLNVLTRDLGIISVFAKGIRRKSSKLNSLNQLFSFNEFELFENKGRYTLNDTSTISTFKKLPSDIYLLTAASQIAEIIIDNSQDIADSPRLYELIIRAFYELERDEKDPKTVTLTAELKLCDYLGYAPMLNGCYVCHDNLVNEQEIYFDFRFANLYCKKDSLKIKERYNYNIQRISPALLACLRYIFSASLEKTFSFNLNTELREELNAFTKLYLVERFDKDYDKISKLDLFS